MNLYKISLFLITGTLLACSPNKEQSVKNSDKKNKNANNASIHSAPQQNSSGLKVFIDPTTGEFQDGPPPGYVTPEKNNTAIQQQQNTNINNENKTADDEIFVNPDGVIYKKAPKP